MTFDHTEFLAALARRQEELRAATHDEELSEIEKRIYAGESCDVLEIYAVFEEMNRRRALSAHERLAEASVRRRLRTSSS